MTTEKTTRDVLVEARALIAKGHAKGVSARRLDGYAVSSRSDDACAWCALAALSVVTNGPYWPAAESLSRVVYGHSNGNIPLWNDAPERTQAEVLEAFDRAIAAQGDAHV
jgi:hypothetical protein